MTEWNTNAQEASSLYARADEADWGHRFKDADQLRAMADKLMRNPDDLYVPF